MQLRVLDFILGSGEASEAFYSGVCGEWVDGDISYREIG